MSADEAVTAAGRHREEVANVTASATVRAARSWATVGADSILTAWQVLLPAVITTVAMAQQIALLSAFKYLTTAFSAQDLIQPRGQLRLDSVVGTMPGTGGDLGAALTGPAYRALHRIGQGASTSVAMRAGLVDLTQLIQTAVIDTSRAAGTVAVGTAPQRVGYVRMVSAGCCSRCAILAGKKYQWNDGFLRHPRCRCTHIPAPEALADDLTTDPYAAFAALSPQEQDRIYTKAGAEAIRNGADMNQVVNSRRGMSPSGRFTSEGTSRRGYARRASAAGQAGRRRLSVDEILRRAGTDKTKFLSLLDEYGYIV